VNDAKFCIEYLTLFLDSHVSPLPQGVKYGDLPGAALWRTDLQVKAQQAWFAAAAFIELHSLKSPTGAVAAFKEAMYNIDHQHWPQGPAGDTIFSSDTMSMLNRVGLVNHIENWKVTSANRKQKRLEKAAAVTEVVAEVATLGAPVDILEHQGDDTLGSTL
jgi:hypothetical protein